MASHPKQSDLTRQPEPDEGLTLTFEACAEFDVRIAQPPQSFSVTFEAAPHG